VSNISDEPAECNAILWVDDTISSNQNIFIPNGTTESIVFITTLAAGDHTIRIGKQLQILTVTPAASAPSSTPAPLDCRRRLRCQRPLRHL
jgi:hypothetical protein